MTRQEALSYYVFAVRGIPEDSLCPKCRGLGHYNYSDGGTWRRGGMATQAFQEDICDKCWGSGNRRSPWTDIRAIEDKFKEWEEHQVLDYMHRKLGLSYDTFRYAVDTLAKECDRQERKRILPNDRPAKMDAFWWSHTWHGMANMLRKLVTHERRSNTTG